MQEKNKDQQQDSQKDQFADTGHGMQGVDKAPGEEPSEDNVQFQQETQKGKQPVDADVSREGERPREQNL